MDNRTAQTARAIHLLDQIRAKSEEHITTLPELFIQIPTERQPHEKSARPCIFNDKVICGHDLETPCSRNCPVWDEKKWREIDGE